MDKAALLRETLQNLSVREVLALARTIELVRVQGKEQLPTDLLLQSMRPRLREARATRVPTLCRLACGVFEDFLTDRDDEPRLPGLIARAAIRPWWRGLLRLRAKEMGEFEKRLAALCAAPKANFESFAGEVRTECLTGTRVLIAELNKPHADASLRQLFANRRLIEDLQEMTNLLEVADPLMAAGTAIDAVLDVVGKREKRLIHDLTPEAVTVAKQHYLTIAEKHDMNARYVALAVLNRLAQPSQVLRIGRALSWKPNAAMVRDTEFGLVGERLILDLQRLARDIVARFCSRRNVPDLTALSAALTHYMDESEGLLGEMGFHRESPWGEAILETRVALGDAMDREFLTRIADQAVLDTILPVDRPQKGRGGTPDPDFSAELAPAAGEAAAVAARFLMLLVLRGSRHGYGQAARGTIDRLGEEIAARTGALIDALRIAPAHPVIEAQIQAAVGVLNILFEDGRGDLLARRMRIANQVTAA
jgi:hypothetical protein